ncbi:WYL domain-containing protein [Shewanella sp. NIFS-20-20]|uniref:WYL domain-containing protein n=1 Tax=Shewanella sp. NIFS-20-20 TaxID=2853806 RepID=UPI001C47A30A|nr:WYL domain-containing protein [Shewanella sp. NIFS-20-20]MBV7317009.1 WYL domain-containing protein [Shewanella sp. NIFS-20-20]
MSNQYSYLELLEKTKSTSKADRLAFIDFLLMFKGGLNRSDLTDFFGIKEASASAAISDYKKHRQGNVTYEHREGKNVIKLDTFNPLLTYSAESALSMLANGFNKGKVDSQRLIPYERVALLPKKLDVEVVSKVTRAITNKTAIDCEYFSRTIGTQIKRRLFPTAIFYDGISWMFRAYSSGDKFNDDGFKSFNFSRLKSVIETTNIFASPTQRFESDKEWHMSIPVVLKVHPSIEGSQKEALLYEFDMDRDTEQLTISVKAVLFYYLVEQWKIDTRRVKEVSKMAHYDNKYNFILINRTTMESYKCMENVLK